MSNSEKVCKFLDESKIFYLATVEGDKPHVRPLGSHKLVNDKLYFLVGDFKNVYKQLLANPNCELVSVKNGGAEWLRISGKVIFEKDFIISDQMMNDSPDLKALYAKNGWKSMTFHIEGHVETFKNFMVSEEKYEI